MKTCLVTIASPEIAKYSDEFTKNKLDYARYRGYDFYCGHQTRKDRAPAWEKISVLNKFLLMDYDFLVWADMDCVFMDFNIEATTLLRDSFWMGACKEFIGSGGLQLCSCLLVIRVNQTSVDFFKEIEDKSKMSDPWEHPWEQEVINQTLLESQFAGVQLWYPAEVGGGWPAVTNEGVSGWTIMTPKDGGQILRGWQPGELILHLGAKDIIPWEIRRREFIEKYQSQVVTGPDDIVPSYIL
jgi:hypothetical protein